MYVYVCVCARVREKKEYINYIYVTYLTSYHTKTQFQQPILLS